MSFFSQATFKNIMRDQPPKFAANTLGTTNVIAFSCVETSSVCFEETKELPFFMPMIKDVKFATLDAEDKIVEVPKTSHAPSHPKTYIALPYREQLNSSIHKFSAMLLASDGKFGIVDLVLRTVASPHGYATHMINALRHATMKGELLAISGNHPVRRNTAYVASIYLESAFIARLDKRSPSYESWKLSANAPPPVLVEELVEEETTVDVPEDNVTFWTSAAGNDSAPPRSFSGTFDNARVSFVAVDDVSVDNLPVLPVVVSAHGVKYACYIRDAALLSEFQDVQDMFGRIDSPSCLTYFTIADIFRDVYTASVSVRLIGNLHVITCIRNVRV